MSVIRGIFFDLGNVLVMYDPKIALRKLANEFQVSEEEIWQYVFLSDIERSYTKGKMTSREFFLQVAKRFPSRLDFHQFGEIWNSIFWENKGMGGLVKSLVPSYDMSLISNTNELHFEYVRKKFPVLSHFRRLFPSHEVGHRKPEPGIFLHALNETQLKPEEVVFIDDVLEFVEGAGNLGMRGIHFKGQAELEKELRRLDIKF